MPLLDHEQAHDLLVRCHQGERGICAHCEQRIVLDYCRTCDEFYHFGHTPECAAPWPSNDVKHYGHRKTIVPFVEVR